MSLILPVNIKKYEHGEMLYKPMYEELEKRVKEPEKGAAKQNLPELYNLKGFLGSIIKNSPDFIVVLNPDGKTILMNATMLNFLDYNMDEVRGKDYLSSFVPAADQEIVSKILKQLIKSKGPTLSSSRVVAKDGRKLLLEWHGRQMFKDNGELDYIWCLGIGITMRKKKEQELVKSEEKLNAIIRTVPDIIYRLDTRGRITFISDSVKQYGYQPEDLLGKYLLDIIHPDDKEKAALKINERRTGQRSTKSYEVRLLRQNQGTSSFEYFLIAAEGLYTSEKPDSSTFIGTQGIAKDISDRKRAEAERLHREKLQGVIEMAGAVCHKLNQPLMTISGYSELISMGISENDPLTGKLVKIIEQIDKLGKITQKLMKITRYETKDYLDGKIIDIDKATE
ncbi:MAG: PAS domain S-box protein [Deltaproteobacteria bacterium]|nr:PAS domain S-box protein [Deltaproteobacteria bacterium]